MSYNTNDLFWGDLVQLYTVNRKTHICLSQWLTWFKVGRLGGLVTSQPLRGAPSLRASFSCTVLVWGMDPFYIQLVIYGHVGTSNCVVYITWFWSRSTFNYVLYDLILGVMYPVDTHVEGPCPEMSE